MPIRKLSPLLVNQIAAGEVIERPASVVKELVENSLDAGATRIDVEVEEGGSTLIRVRDDGSGIPPDELPLALAAHATSKLAEPGDLESIRTMGFRGEALASIASVSRLALRSRPRGAEAATLIEQAGDDLKPPRPTAGGPGTVVEVRDLFFNTPARRKFLRSPPTEFGHIHETLQRLAMMHPAIGFSLSHAGRTVLDLQPGDDARRRCVELLGRDLDEALLTFEQQEPDGSRVWGLAGLPAIARATAKYQHLSLNGRPIRDRGLAHAIKEAYRGLIAPDKQAVAVVMLTLDPRTFDVNVHPAKSEVRFREPTRVHGLVLAALRQRLLGSDLTHSPWRSHTPPESEPRDFVEHFRQMDPVQKGFIYEEVAREMGRDLPPRPTDAAALPTLTPTPRPAADHLQVHQSYLVTQDDQGIVIVDQHALHERVMFERLRQRIVTDRGLESQRLLVPDTVEADAGRLAALEALQPLMQRLGIEAQPIGPRSIAVHGFPSLLFEKGVEPGPFLAQLLDKGQEGGFDLTDASREEAALHEALDMMACKAAVKAGDKLTPAEVSDLLAQREMVERSGSCPHGRPTTIRLTLRDLEKRFGRT